MSKSSALTCLKRLGGRIALVTLVPAASLWMIAATWFANLLPGDFLPLIATVVIALAVLAILALVKNLWQAIGLILALFTLIFIRWLLISPSNDRPWQPQVALLPTATFADDDTVTIHNLRNNTYRSRTDFDPHYEDRTYRLDDLKGVSFLVSYWGNQSIAHTFLSFEFAGALPLALSIEIRPEIGESYNPLAGLFKEYEITYVLGDERDLIGMRASHRGEDVYLYRCPASPGQARTLLLDVLERVNRLAEKPAFYRTIGANCTTSLVAHVNKTLENKIPFSGSLLLNGFSDKLVYDRGNILRPLSFLQLKSAAHVTPIARTLERDPAFSEKIRAHIAKEVEALRSRLPATTPGS